MRTDSVFRQRHFHSRRDRLRESNHLNAAKDYANYTIRDYMQPGKANKFNNNIHEAMIADANRSTYILNGTTYDYKPAAELVPAFKALVPDPVKQKAISSWINQLCMTAIIPPSIHVPYETGVAPGGLPGTGALVNRDMTTGVFTNSILNTCRSTAEAPADIAT